MDRGKRAKAAVKVAALMALMWALACAAPGDGERGGAGEPEEASTRLCTAPSVPPYVPRQLLAKFAPGVSEEKSRELLERVGAARVLKEMDPSEGRVLLVELNGEVSVEEAAAALASFPEVEYAEANHLSVSLSPSASSS